MLTCLDLIELEKEYPAQTYLHLVTGYKSGDLHLGRRTFLAAWLQIMQAWYVSSPKSLRLLSHFAFACRTGVTSVVVYAPTLFRIAGFSQHKVKSPECVIDLMHRLVNEP